MISGKDIYDVLAALVPLYVAMILAYASVRWWKIFTWDQCSGINRFVAVFAVPLLSFHFISSNNPYSMNLRFLAADSIQKIATLVAFILWNTFTKHGSLDWMITMFSVSTLPNTLILGIPLLKSMYGDFSGSLMVQIIVLQSVIWYTVILFMFEYRAAKLLISEQLPGTAKSITSFKVDSDVVSLGSKETLKADSEIGEDGKIHVVVRKSNPSSLESSFNKSHLNVMTPIASNLTGIEIYSLQSSLEPTPRGSSFNQADLFTMFPGKASRNSWQSNGNGNGGAGFSRQFSKGLTEEMSNLEDEKKKIGWRSRSTGSFNLGVLGNSSYATPNTAVFSGSNSGRAWKKDGGGSERYKELHKFVWSQNGSTDSEGNQRYAANTGPSPEFGSSGVSKVVPGEAASAKGGHELTGNKNNGLKVSEEWEIEKREGTKRTRGAYEHLEEGINANEKQQMPPAGVMTRLILIMVWRKLIRNPNTYASFLGLAWAFISFRWHIQMPTMVQGSISILSKAGLGMAMFSIGLFMALQPKIIACGKSVAAISMAVRFLAGPAVMAATSAAMGIRGVLLQVAIIQAALPQAIVPFVFAKEYNVHADVLSTGVIFGMLIALPIALVYYVLLGL